MNKLSNEYIHEAVKNNKLYQFIENTYAYMIRYCEFFEKPNLLYHSLEHGKQVAERVLYLYLNHNDFYHIETEKHIKGLLICAVFHDIGYYVGATPETHEDVGASVLGMLLKNDIGYADYRNYAIFVKDTNVYREPQYSLSEILRDADLLHWCFEYDKFIEQNELIGLELGFDPKSVGFMTSTRQFLKKHSLVNPYLEKLKIENINQIKTYYNTEYGM